jgi:DNA polymerase
MSVGKSDTGLQGLITVHPSFLLRAPDEAARKAEYAAFVRDLRIIVRDFPAMRAALNAA